MISLFSTPASAEDGAHWWSGDWYLTLGATAFRAPEFNGDDNYIFQASPLISIGRAGKAVRFSSRNDNPSFAFIDTDAFRAGAAGKLIFKRDKDTSSDLAGLEDVRFGGELGGFAEVYPTDWLRARAEVRKGIRSHHGVVADVAVDGFIDLTDNLRVSGGPRVSFATADYFDAYYGVDAAESVASGLAQYTPGGGMKSAGIGTAITWKPTEKIETTAFAEYERLTGPAADSSLVEQRGSKNQFIFGLSATYRFDFTLN
ncbi:MipA/OmpV family protein [Pararhizobium sp.]|uniref:MipA/OmpV family protein n=1 Tax=Pararhizobium sp. TaxID=1977563 RepID=UPI00272828AC|nr:MipA/OmpV family protein [Pararhizobium sp.]MDO9415700.1 MipA/OmpV family protein [Pararhizobium sp.]